MALLIDLPTDVQILVIKSHLSKFGEYSGYREGSFGEIHTLIGSGFPLVAKCPKRTRFRSDRDAREALGKLADELSQSFSHFRYSGVQRWSDIVFIHHWPFLIGRLRKGTLSDLIKAPNQWNLTNRLSSLIMIAHSLGYCYSRGMAAHQDLKPENILFETVAENFQIPADYLGPKHLMFVADFGMANAFRDIGVNTGSRPYMAPEQYSKNEIIDGSRIDVFSLGVIAFECLCDGMHPIGEITDDVWPVRLPDKPGKWGHEDIWKNWARRSSKDIYRRLCENCPMLTELGDKTNDLSEIIENALKPDPRDRPDMATFEEHLWKAFHLRGSLEERGLRVVLEHFDRAARDAEPHGWPHLEERLAEARQAYAEWKIG